MAFGILISMLSVTIFLTTLRTLSVSELTGKEICTAVSSSGEVLVFGSGYMLLNVIQPREIALQHLQQACIDSPFGLEIIPRLCHSF